MNKLYYKVPNIEIKNALAGLAYWVADISYIRERFGTNNNEFISADKSVKLCFESLDRLGVPFWVQNSVVAFADDWRRYKSCYMENWLFKNRNIEF